MMVEEGRLKIAMFSIHSCPVGELGTKDTGGMNVYIRELASELGKRGHRVDVYTRMHDPKDPQVIELGENVRVIHLKAGKNGYMHKLAIYPFLPDFSSALQAFIRREALQYDLIHSHYWLSGWVGKWAKARWNVPHLLMFHTLGAVKNTTGVGQEEPRLRIATERQLVGTCQRIIAATEREKRELIQFYDAEPDTIGVVPCGVNLDLFRPVERAAARRKLGFDDDGRIVIYVGRFAALKGIDRLLSAMTYLRDDHKLKLVIIGGDGDNTPEFKRLKSLSKEWRIRDRVSFAGRIEQEDLPSYYSAADVLAVPSYHESFGLVALESLACGTPVVATKVGAMDRIILEGKTGCVVANANPYLLAKGIKAFFPGSHLKAPSADSIRASVLQFDWSNIAEAMIDEYGFVLGHPTISSTQSPPSEPAALSSALGM